MTTASKKQLIIQSAAELFQNKGYNATSIRDVAAHVGLEPSSLYSHIKSKEELLNEICKECANAFTQGMQSILEQKKSPVKSLKLIIKLHVDIAFDEPASVTVFNDEWRHLTGPFKEVFLSQRKVYENNFKAILLEGKNQKKFWFDDVDIAFLLVLKLLTIGYTSVSKYNKTFILEQLTYFILNALKK